MFKAIARQSFPRTFDEAFRTPAWFTPVEGPFKRQREPGHHSHWVVLIVVLLMLILALAAGAGA